MIKPSFTVLRCNAAALVLLGLAAHGLAAAQEVVRVQDYRGLGNLMLRVAIAHQLCDKQGIKCEQRTIPAAPLGLQTLLAGDLEVAFGPPEVMVQAAAKGAEIRILGNGARGSLFFVVAGNPLDTPNAAKGYPAVMQDFKGKKIGVTARGTGAEFQFIDLLKGAGMSAADVTLVAVGAPNTALPALTHKQVDAVMAFEPMSGFCEVLKACRVVVDPRKGEGPAELLAVANAGSVLTVRNDYLLKKPQAVAGFVAAMKENEAFMQNPANCDAVLKVSLDTFKIEIPKGPEVVAAVLKTSLPAYRFAMDAKSVQAAADYRLASKQLEKAFDTNRLVFGKCRRCADPARSTHQGLAMLMPARPATAAATATTTAVAAVEVHDLSLSFDCVRPHGAGQRRLRPQDTWPQHGRVPRHRPADADPGGAVRFREQLPQGPVARHAPACCIGPHLCHRSRPVADGRALRRARRPDQAAAARPAAVLVPGLTTQRGVRHPRSVRGGGGGRPGGGDVVAARAHRRRCAGRPAAPALDQGAAARPALPCAVRPAVGTPGTRLEQP